MQVVDGSCRIKLGQVVTLVAAVRFYWSILLEQNNTNPGTWYTAIDLTNAFRYTNLKYDMTYFILTWNGQKYTCTVSSQGSLNFLFSNLI